MPAHTRRSGLHPKADIQGGCEFGLNVLIRHVAVRRIVIVADARTDAAALKDVVDHAWAQCRPTKRG